MMAMILRVIPNSLYEKLEKSDLLWKEFPSPKEDCMESLLQEVPTTLKSKARQILEAIKVDKTIGWNSNTKEVTIETEVINGSDISKLVHTLVMQSQKYSTHNSYSIINYIYLILFLDKIPD